VSDFENCACGDHRRFSDATVTATATATAPATATANRDNTATRSSAATSGTATAPRQHSTAPRSSPTSGGFCGNRRFPDLRSQAHEDPAPPATLPRAFLARQPHRASQTEFRLTSHSPVRRAGATPRRREAGSGNAPHRDAPGSGEPRVAHFAGMHPVRASLVSRTSPGCTRLRQALRRRAAASGKHFGGVQPPQARRRSQGGARADLTGPPRVARAFTDSIGRD
jgi:hypothetical protein